jgi:hypothetical protein
VVRKTECDKSLINNLIKISENQENHFKVIAGKTLCANDFYEGILFKPI